jgi:hypothetical protein
MDGNLNPCSPYYEDGMYKNLDVNLNLSRFDLWKL